MGSSSAPGRLHLDRDKDGRLEITIFDLLYILDRMSEELVGGEYVDDVEADNIM